MKIAHFTNTFLPHVGGVARAVQTVLEDQRRSHHRVLVVAPEFADGTAPQRIEKSVLRIPALKNFNESDFSVRLPMAATFAPRLSAFPTDIIHAHHPFLLGDTALRVAASRQVPVVFTHHTLYEHYTHYLPVAADAAGDFAADVATRFANRCAAIIAPSESVKDLIISRGVTAPVHVIPTGIDTRRIKQGSGRRARAKWRLPARAPILGHLGRLAAEKNLVFLATALASALRRAKTARALIVGDGPARTEMEAIFSRAGVADRVVFTGTLTGRRLYDACAAMDVFAFASTSETQGLVLAEAMAAGAAVVALDASGVRDVVRDQQNGRLLSAATTPTVFARCLATALAHPATLKRWQAGARRTAMEFDRRHTTAKLLALYSELVAEARRAQAQRTPLQHKLTKVVERVATEGRIIADKAGALIGAVAGTIPTVAEDNAA